MRAQIDIVQGPSSRDSERGTQTKEGGFMSMLMRWIKASHARSAKDSPVRTSVSGQRYYEKPADVLRSPAVREHLQNVQRQAMENRTRTKNRNGTTATTAETTP